MDMASDVARREKELFQEHALETWKRTDRIFAWLMLAQWVFAIGLALTFSPYAWAGKQSAVHLHVWIALFLGGVISSVPITLILLRPGWVVTRHVVAVAQILWSALLIHLSGGRIETHFHVFGSLAFLAFYRDFRVLITATIVVAADHFVRGLFWSESVYGVATVDWWRFGEHAFWVVFENTILTMACVRGVAEMRAIAERQATVEALSESERQNSAALDRALSELRESQDALVRTEKLAAVGQLAASVGHELRNPLAAVRNAHSYIQKRLADPSQTAAKPDARVGQFMELIDRELSACTKIISDLLDFARERRPARSPCPLRPLTAAAIDLVPQRARVLISNGVPETLPVPSLDPDQFRQVLANLVQNAVEAMPETGGTVLVGAEGGGGTPWRIFIKDDGPGMPAEVMGKIFQPLYTTKTKGTGLGLSIVASMVSRHEGSIKVDSIVGRGTTFMIELPVVVDTTSHRSAAACQPLES
jgi:two-component system sensor histidine kinase HydH